MPTFTKAPAYGLMERGGEGGSTVGSDHPRGTSKRVLADTLRSQIEERERHRREQREREVAQERDFIHHLNRECVVRCHKCPCADLLSTAPSPTP